MKDHGITPEPLYPTMDKPQEKIYPSIVLPAEAFEGESYEPGHKCTLKIEVEIEMMTKENYHCKLLRSEEEEDDKE